LFSFIVPGIILFASGGGHADDPLVVTQALQSLLGVPADMAIVKDGYVPRGQRFLHYVLIEDAHESAEAQGKIAAIVLYAHHHWGSRQAFIEGAFGPIGPPPFPIFTPERGDRGMTELLQQGLISAGELAAALSSAPDGESFTVEGMDHPLLYRRQLEALVELSALRGRAIKQLGKASAMLSPGQKHSFRRLLELRMTPADYRDYLWTLHPSFHDPDLARAINRAEAYYRLTDLRSEIFVRRTQERIGNGPCLLIMGGFHTPRIARMLRERGESFVILTPRLTQGGRHEFYERHLVKTHEEMCRFPFNSPASSAASPLRLSLACETN
jgi:hypothetical protein